MSKTPYPLHEPRPAYMRQIGMQWARYIEGVTDPPAGTPAAPPAAAPAAAIPPKPDDPPKVPELDAAAIAALQVKVANFEAAEATRAQEAQAKANAELSDLQKAQRDNTALALKLARAEALAAHPVPAAYQSLVQGTDEASFLASAKLASELAAKAEGKAPPPDPIPNAGTGGAAPTVSSLDAGRDLYNLRHGKTS